MFRGHFHSHIHQSVQPTPSAQPQERSNPEEFYHLTVRLIAGHHLMVGDVTGYSDPYCELRLGSSILRSHTVPQTLDPVWNQSFEFRINRQNPAPPNTNNGQQLNSPSQMFLVISVYDFDRFKRDDFLGCCVIALNQLIQGRPCLMTVPLNEASRGSISIELTAHDFGLPSEFNRTTDPSPVVPSAPPSHSPLLEVPSHTPSPSLSHQSPEPNQYMYKVNCGPSAPSRFLPGVLTEEKRMPTHPGPNWPIGMNLKVTPDFNFVPQYDNSANNQPSLPFTPFLPDQTPSAPPLPFQFCDPDPTHSSMYPQIFSPPRLY